MDRFLEGVKLFVVGLVIGIVTLFLFILLSAGTSNSQADETPPVCVPISEYMDYLHAPPGAVLDAEIFATLQGEDALAFAVLTRFDGAAMVGTVWLLYASSVDANAVFVMLGDGEGCMISMDGTRADHYSDSARGRFGIERLRSLLDEIGRGDVLQELWMEDV